MTSRKFKQKFWTNFEGRNFLRAIDIWDVESQKFSGDFMGIFIWILTFYFLTIYSSYLQWKYSLSSLGRVSDFSLFNNLETKLTWKHDYLIGNITGKHRN